MNGTVNLSVLDGWWAEAYDGTNGWGMPPSEHENPGERDREDARTLYETLQDDVIPLYYDRDPKLGYSAGWVARSKRSMVSVLPHFNSRRVLHDYAVGFYGPAARHGRQVEADGYAVATDLAAWKRRVHHAWPGVTLRLIGAPQPRLEFHAPLELEVEVSLGELSPGDVRVECVLHRELCSEVAVPVKTFSRHVTVADGVRELDDDLVLVEAFEPTGQPGEAPGSARYRLSLESPWAGGLRFEIRAVPSHAHLTHPYETGLMRWL
jgi:starch phosphorylase